MKKTELSEVIEFAKEYEKFLKKFKGVIGISENLVIGEGLCPSVHLNNEMAKTFKRSEVTETIRGDEVYPFRYSTMVDGVELFEISETRRRFSKEEEDV